MIIRGSAIRTCRIARIMLDEGKDLDFWVKKAAEKLLDLVSVSNYRWISHLNLDSEEEQLEDEFKSVPDWLRDVAKENEPLISWLPISPDELNLKTPSSVFGGSEDESSIGLEEEKKEDDLDEVVEEYDAEGMAIDEPLDKERLLYVDSNTKAVELAKEICERRKCRKLFGSSKFD